MKISVLIAAYNIERFITKCIYSVINQKYKEIEAIIVSDGSSDTTDLYCDLLAKADSRLFIVHKRNEGVSSSRNIGLLLSSSKYISFVDGDDYIDDNLIGILYDAIYNYQADISICSANVVNNDNKITEAFIAKDQIVSGVNVIETYDYKNAIYMVPWAKLYKRELFDDVKYPINIIHEDEFVFHKIYSLANRIVCVNRKMYFYVKHNNSIMSNENEKGYIDAVDALLERLEWEVENINNQVCLFDTVRMISKMLNIIKNSNESIRINSIYRKILKETSIKCKSLYKRTTLFMEYLFPGFINRLENILATLRL